VIVARRVSGLGSLKQPNSFSGSFLPAAIGGGLTAIATMAVKMLATPKTDAATTKGLAAHWQQMGLGADAAAAAATTATAVSAQTPTQAMLIKWAPAIGVVVGGLGAAALGMLAGKPAGYGAAAGAGVVGGVLLADMLLDGKMGFSGVGAILPEYGTAGARRLGAIVMEPESAQGYNAYSGGETVNVKGLGRSRGVGAGMDVSAFGPASF
jgi:hypothetical protein